MRLSASRLIEAASVSILALASASLLSGCIFDRLQRSDQNDIARVEQKQATLQTEEARSATLSERQEQLAQELERQEMSLDELTRRVQQINEDNGRAISDERAASSQYHDLLLQLHDTSQQIALAERGSDADSMEARRERITSLKGQLRAQLNRLLER